MTHIYNAMTTPGLVPSAWDWEAKPLCVLVSFAYLKQWDSGIQSNPRVKPKRMMLDSGAFTAYNVGKTIDIDALIAECANPRWDEAVGLDVIGDANGSRRNADYMRERGCMAMPVFHIGDPWDLLDHYCDHWPKVGLSCLFGEPRKESLRFYEQCFARRWRHRFHSFGWAAEEVLMRFPFDSADSSTWIVARTYHNFHFKAGGVFKQRHLSPPKDHHDMVDHGVANSLDISWRLEQRLSSRWAKELNPLRKDAA